MNGFYHQPMFALCSHGFGLHKHFVILNKWHWLHLNFSAGDFVDAYVSCITFVCPPYDKVSEGRWRPSLTKEIQHGYFATFISSQAHILQRSLSPSHNTSFILHFQRGGILIIQIYSSSLKGKDIGEWTHLTVQWPLASVCNLHKRLSWGLRIENIFVYFLRLQTIFFFSFQRGH